MTNQERESLPRVAVLLNGGPEAGGGSVLIRSQVEALSSRARFEFFYLSEKPATSSDWHYLGRPFIMAPGISGPVNLLMMILGLYPKQFRFIVKRILAEKFDRIWVISNDDGAFLAKALRRKNRGIPIHLSVHDHLGDTIFKRSRRYKRLSFIGTILQTAALRSASSCDVVASGMLREAQSVCKGEVFLAHRYIKSPFFRSEGNLLSSVDELHVGHIGSVYDIEMFRDFLIALDRYGKVKGLTTRLTLIGASQNYDSLLGTVDRIEHYRNLQEDRAVTILSASDFCYCQYSMNPALARFPTTSFPTKVSTYLLARRPILYHGPKDADINWFVQRHGVGASCFCRNDNLEKSIDEVMSITPNAADYRAALEDRFGGHITSSLARALCL